MARRGVFISRGETGEGVAFIVKPKMGHHTSKHFAVGIGAGPVLALLARQGREEHPRGAPLRLRRPAPPVPALGVFPTRHTGPRMDECCGLGCEPGGRHRGNPGPSQAAILRQTLGYNIRMILSRDKMSGVPPFFMFHVH